MRPFLLLLPLLLTSVAFADLPIDPKIAWKREDGNDNRWNEANVGPFLASVLDTPSGTVAKGLSIRLGDAQDISACYDLKTASIRAVWRGQFLKFNPRKFGVVVAPQMDGQVQLVSTADGWGVAKIEYLGFHQHGRRVVLSYRADGVEVLESPWGEVAKTGVTMTRTIQLAPHPHRLTMTLLRGTSHVSKLDKRSASARWNDVHTTVDIIDDGKNEFDLRKTDYAVQLVLPPTKETETFTIAYSSTPAAQFDEDKKIAVRLPNDDLKELSKPGPALWTKDFITQGKLGTGAGPYVADTLTLPLDNSYKALMFISGHDFFANGDMAVSTLHGDVWTVRGVDAKLQRTIWRRYATGLHQPLGLRIVDDIVYVLGKDQITRLEDRNDDGEADYYANFNNAGKTSVGGHDYAACLETDAEGNFYYIRAHEGVVKVSKDGRQHQAIATGFRNPIGLGVGPQGTVTASPQEGNWTPASNIAFIKPGGYYGFGGPKVAPTRPLGYDPPMCWMPRLQDNSSGGQVWVTSKQWGPLHGQLLHLSYGQCALLLAPHEIIAGQAQGGTIRFPLTFQSGVMRGRFNPRDGQLYLSGMRGWQSSAVKDGCLQRVRYTGKSVHMPAAIRVQPQGIALTFTEKLQTDSASDPNNYSVEWWNYRYTKEYGSADYKVSQPKRFGREEVYVEDATLREDGRTVFLELEEIRPVMQMQITYSIKSADGTPIKQTIYNTIHAVPKAKTKAP